MKVAIFNLSIGYAKKSYDFMPKTNYCFHSFTEIEDNTIINLLEDNLFIVIGDKLYIKIPDNFTEINEVYNTSDLEEGDRVIILEEFSLLESMIATVLPIVRGVYKLEGTPLINNGIIRSTDGFKKLYGKNFNIFKLI